ncbi:DnaJ-like, subfamily C, member 28, conserved domain protein [Solidesulfovibrio fructosivorans JJ]]|uniref:DnaJ-like, subfamily C, member 28, conserved domain protein n=1 Tax=Solidesulfovibrio fructosivorans JJ] TaxID=596151 RepID=E1JVD2_SOLFR|nr:DUF1992 domain-containing protein [Solidesulfovibrio fructosivorans]EFL51726.1 DnaJ-like, subfamily C, member 28, conserved domain protein [Solidesulfovibrio fructosivorans JJ]]
MFLQAVSIIAEERIAASMRNGDFENLEGKGKKIVFEDDSMIPEDLRMAYKILKNAGYVPEELTQEKEIITAAELLAAATDEQERYRQMQKLNYLIMKVNARRRRPVNLERDADYYRRVVERVTVRGAGREAQDR